ncbi:hypothetical protein Bbelb_303420 [Branchiostoma belcheri]|nr:hypothetical protein Bbelb_303420 [Branchiostoma belcheri]
MTARDDGGDNGAGDAERWVQADAAETSAQRRPAWQFDVYDQNINKTPAEEGKLSYDKNAFTCHQCRPGHECKLGDEREDICPAGTASNDDRTMCVPCAAGEFSSAPGAASCQGIDSCSDVKSLLPRASDGEYTFRPFPTNKDVSLRIYCYNMASGNPKEFLSLPSGPYENFAHVYPYRLLTAEQCNGLTTRDYDYAGTTNFSKLRIKFDKSRIEVIRDDYTFARTTGVNGYLTSVGESRIEVTLWRRMAAAQTLATGCAKGEFKVNLIGTKLKLANVEWKLNEHWPQNLQISDMTKSDDGKESRLLDFRVCCFE